MGRPLTNKNLKSDHVLDYKHVKGNGDDSDPWRDNDRPKLYVDYLKGPLKDEVERFKGNKTTIDNFKLMEMDDKTILIGATNNVFFINPTDLTEYHHLRIEWHPSSTDFELCAIKGKTKAECQNHIRVVAKLTKEKLLLCGTHSYRPRCRHYHFKVN